MRRIKLFENYIAKKSSDYITEDDIKNGLIDLIDRDYVVSVYESNNRPERNKSSNQIYMPNIKSFKLFESFNEESLKGDITDCLVELMDLGIYEYTLNVDIADKYVYICIKVDESDVEDEEYFHYTKKFDVSSISEPILLLEDYMRDKFGHSLYIDYRVFNDDIDRFFSKFPTYEYVESIRDDEDYEDEVELIEATTKLVMKYKWQW